MAVKRGNGRGSEYIVVRIGVGDKVKRVPRLFAERYFAGERPASHDEQGWHAFFRCAVLSPDPRVRGQYEQIRAALAEERRE